MASQISALELKFRSDVILEANSIPLLIGFLSDKDDETVFLAIRATLRCVGTAIMNNNHFRAAVLSESDRAAYCEQLEDRAAAAARQLAEWAHAQFARLGGALARLCGHAEGGVAIPALGALGELITLMHESAAQRPIPLQRDWIQKAVEGVVGKPPQVAAALVETFGARRDTRMAVWEALAGVLDRKQQENDENELVIAATEVFEIGKMMGPPLKDGPELLRFNAENLSAKKLFSREKKAFSKVWAVLLTCPMTTTLYKAVLADFPTLVLPFLSHPVMSVDFCFQAYNKGGYCALLSLKSLFVIATTLNIDVPQFYPKLYALLSPAVFVSKRRAEFFQLTDLFLSSEYLPLSTAAAFAKKLARLALFAPAAGAVVCLQLVFNIIRRHPSTSFLIHAGSAAAASGLPSKNAEKDARPKKKWKRAEAVDRRNLDKKAGKEEEEEEGDDYVPETTRADDEEDIVTNAAVAELPILMDEEEEEDAFSSRRHVESAEEIVQDAFDADTLDPEASRAMESQLWELLSLKRHAVPAVSEAAALFAADMERPLFDLAQGGALTTHDLVDKLRRKKVKSVPLEYRAKRMLLPEETLAFYFA